MPPGVSRSPTVAIICSTSKGDGPQRGRDVLLVEADHRDAGPAGRKQKGGATGAVPGPDDDGNRGHQIPCPLGQEAYDVVEAGMTKVVALEPAVIGRLHDQADLPGGMEQVQATGQLDGVVDRGPAVRGRHEDDGTVACVQADRGILRQRKSSKSDRPGAECRGDVIDLTRLVDQPAGRRLQRVTVGNCEIGGPKPGGQRGHEVVVPGRVPEDG